MNVTDTTVGLGEFLRTRRARLRPQDVALSAYGGRRRVPGLRREELAQLAGVSVAYYTRLEQGLSTNASDGVLDALARALRLTDDEYAHLRDLARRGRRPRPVVHRHERARRGIRRLIDAMGPDVAAIVLDRRTDVLAWNLLGHALVAGHLPLQIPESPTDRPNLSSMLFLDPLTRELYRHWDEEAERAVASLRVVAGRFTGDRRLAELVRRLSTTSPEFAASWSRHPVRTCTYGTKELLHPVVGPLEVSFEVLDLPDGSGQRLLTYHAESGSASEAALRLLGRP